MISAAKTRHKFFNSVLREFIDQTLESDQALSKALAQHALTSFEEPNSSSDEHSSTTPPSLTPNPKSPRIPLIIPNRKVAISNIDVSVPSTLV